MAAAALPLALGAATGGVAYLGFGATAMTALAMGAGVAGAVGSVQAGYQQQALMEYNAKVSENNAQAAIMRARYEEQRQRTLTKKFLGRMEAAQANTGFAPGGSLLEDLADAAGQAELDALAIRWNGDVEYNRHMSEAAVSRWQGKLYAQQGWVKAGQSLLMSAAAASAPGAFGAEAGAGGHSAFGEWVPVSGMEGASSLHASSQSWAQYGSNVTVSPLP
jgi:hypothetical protein